MKKLRYRVVLFILISFVFVSCSKEEFLDIEPQGIKIPSTNDDFRLLLDNESLFRIKHNITAFGSDQVFASTEIDNQTVLTVEAANQYLFQDFFYNAATNDPDWSLYYNQIFNANLILDGLSKLDGTDVNVVSKLEAEAKLYRAYAYFNLVNMYSVHYNPATASTDLGVPIREGFSLFNVDLTRATVQEVYDFIMEDISTSIDDLSDTQSLKFSFRPSKAGAHALLAKVYLYQAKYDEALESANNALNLNNVLVDINDIPESGDPAIRLFPNTLENVEILWHKDAPVDLVLIKDFGDLFEADDLRLQWLEFFPETFEGDPVLGNVEVYGLQANQCLSCGTEGLSTPDMYLVRAESNARVGNIEDANNDLNALRVKRYRTNTYTDLDITDQDALLAFVKEERLREFPSSIERPFDIKRYNRLDNDNITVTHTYDGETVSIAPNSKNWAQPIGQIYINFNPEIEQNERD